uniref:CSON000830 protein n=1 Tax=Culicoides sonorensis TaxID=179676 RepID=A0A336MFV5_CULSO
MGCGQSKIHLYPRKNKSKANGKKNGHNDDNEGDEDEGQNNDDHRKEITCNEKDKINDDDQLTNNPNDATNGEITIPILRNGPLLQSHSQQNFFRMLDEKIEQGPDYDSASETEIALEEARLNSLIQHWESASITASMCSSTSRSLQGTPIRQVSLRQHLLAQQPKFVVGANSPNKIPIRPMPIQMSAQAALFNQTSYAGLAGTQPLPSTQSTVPTILSSLSSTSSSALQQQQQQLPTSQQQQIRSTRTLPQQPPLAVTQQVLPITTTTTTGPPVLGQQPLVGPNSNAAMNYYSASQQIQPPPQSFFGEVLHPIQVPQNSSSNAPQEPRFPPAISVQRLAPQVQRQLRETQELIKDSTVQLYAAGYGSPGPPQMPVMRVPQRASRRPPTNLETQYTQELS